MGRAPTGRPIPRRRTDRPGWEVLIELAPGPDGHRRRKKITGRTKGECSARADEIIRRRDAGLAVEVGDATTLSAWLDLWVMAKAASGVRPNTISGYRTDLKHVQRSGVGVVRLRTVGPEHIEQVYAHARAAGCGDGTILHIRRTLSAALRVAAERGHIRANPVPMAMRPSYDETTATVAELRPYDRDEIAALLASAANRRNGVRWSLALLGMRQGEVLGLRWSDVDLDLAELRVTATLTWLPWQHGCTADGLSDPICGRRGSECPRRHSGGAHLGPPKSQAGRRPVGLPAPVVDQLRAHRRAQAAEQLAAGPLWRDSGLVIAGRRGGPVDRTSDTESWDDLCADAGVRRLRIHDLRHSAATLLLEMGEDSRTLMGLFGWTSPNLVARYAHMTARHRESVAAKQAEMWGATPDQARARDLPG